VVEDRLALRAAGPEAASSPGFAGVRAGREFIPGRTDCVLLEKSAIVSAPAC